LKHLSVKIAVGASLAYALIAILFNLITALIVLAVGPMSELYSSPVWTLKNVAVSSLVLVSVLVGVGASVTALVRHRDARLVTFLALTLSCVGLSVQGLNASQILSQWLHRS